MALNSDGVEAIESVRNNWNELSIHFGNKLKLGRVGSMKLQGKFKIQEKSKSIFILIGLFILNFII